MADNPSTNSTAINNPNPADSHPNNPTTIPDTISQQQQQQFLQQQSNNNNNNLMSGYQTGGGNGMQRTPSMSRLNSGIYGQMSFNGQQQQGGNGGNVMSRNEQFSRSVLMGNMPLAAAAAQLNLQSQLLSSPRQKSGLLQGTQFSTGGNSAGQTLQNMHAMGMINPLINTQMRTNGTMGLTHQQRMNIQMRQQILQQASLNSNPKLQAQGLQRQSYMNAQLSGLTQNGQPNMLQNSVSQQQWSRQMPAMSTPNSSSYRVQHQRQPPSPLLQHQSTSSQQNSMGLNLNPQQLSQLAQQQQQQAPTPPQQLLNQQPQSSLRMPMPTGQRSVSLTGSQPDATGSGNTTPGGRSSQGTESSNQLLGKRKIQDLVSQVDPRGRLDSEVEDLLLELADDFIDSVTTFACSLAKHRNSTTLESKDVLLHLEKNWNLTIPGFSSEERKNRQNSVSKDLHKKRLDTIHALMEPSQSDTPINISKDASRQGFINQGGINHMLRPSPSSDQLVSQSNTSQMVQQMNRF